MGRPGKYKKWLTYDGLNLIRKMAKEEHTDIQIAKQMGISRSTLYEWYDKFPEIERAIVCKGRTDIDYKIIKPNGKKKYIYFKNESEVKFCHDCKEFVESREYVDNNHKCKMCNRKRGKRYRKTDEGKDAKRKYAVKYYEENKDKVYEMVYKRHTKLRNNIYNYSSQDWKDTLSHFNNECAYCGIDNADLEREHVIPVSKNGAYIKSNIIPACRSCNMSKLDRFLEDWYPKQEFYSELKHKKINRWTRATEKSQQLALL